MKTLSYFLPLIFSLGTLSATKEITTKTVVDKWVRETRPKSQWPEELTDIINDHFDIKKDIEEKKIFLLLKKIEKQEPLEKSIIKVKIWKKNEKIALEKA